MADPTSENRARGDRLHGPLTVHGCYGAITIFMVVPPREIDSSFEPVVDTEVYEYFCLAVSTVTGDWATTSLPDLNTALSPCTSTLYAPGFSSVPPTWVAFVNSIL